MSGLWKKHDHEKSAHNDKKNNDDYKKNFASPAIQKPSSSPFEELGLRFTSGGRISRTPAWYRELARKWKDQIKRELRRITNRHPVVVCDQQFAFSWGVQEFATANSLDAGKAAKVFELVRKEALNLREMVERRLLRAELHREKRYDPEQRSEVEFVELKFGLNDITQLLHFADGFRIEDEFFSKLHSPDAKPQHENGDGKNQTEPP